LNEKEAVRNSFLFTVELRGDVLPPTPHEIQIIETVSFRSHSAKSGFLHCSQFLYKPQGKNSSKKPLFLLETSKVDACDYRQTD